MENVVGTRQMNLSLVREALQNLTTRTTMQEEMETRIRDEAQAMKVPPALDWAEAQRIQSIVDVETLYNRKRDETGGRLQIPTPGIAEYKPIDTRARGSFRWTVRHCKGDNGEPAACFLAIDGNVSDVYPGVHCNETTLDGMWLVRFFPAKAQCEMYEHHISTLNGVPMDGKVFTHHSLPQYDFIVQIEIHNTIRYHDANGEIVAIQTGVTRDATQSLRDYTKVISNIIAEHRDSVDHRFGNKIKLMHLLLEDGRYKELSAQFERLQYEVLIRRKLFSQLPPIEPISIYEFLHAEFSNLDLSIFIVKPFLSPKEDIEDFSFSSTRSQESTQKGKEITTKIGLLFSSLESKEGNRRPLSAIVLQILLLQDLASNAYRHGDGRLRVTVSENQIVFENNVAPENILEGVKKYPSRHIGLGVLKQVCSELGLGIEFNMKHDTFTAIFSCGIQFVDLSSPLQSPSSLTSVCSDNSSGSSKSLPLQQDEPSRQLNANDFSWCLVEDETLICQIFHKTMKKRHSINTQIIQTPPEVANAVKSIAYHCLKNKDKRAHICIIDENLLEMNDHGDLVAVTGTTIRDRLSKSDLTSKLLQDSKLLIVSASASHVNDDRCFYILGKTGAVSSDISHILDAARRHLLVSDKKHNSPLPQIKSP